jgi:alpha-beta hydrolase superfamily lysophospholipase
VSPELQDIEQGPALEGVEELRLRTDAGTIECRFHPVEDDEAAVIWVGGANGGLDGPAGGMYPRLAKQLAHTSIASLRLHYRRPNNLMACVMDTLIGVAYLEARGINRVALVGHSFGGAVVITAGALSDTVKAVAALSSQTYGTDDVDELTPRPLLLIHGMADEILPDACSRDIYARAQEPKVLKLYPGCNHGLDLCRDAVDHDLLDWLQQVLAGAYDS